MKIMCLDNLEKTFYTTNIYREMLSDTIETFKLAKIEVIKFDTTEVKRLLKIGYREVK